MSTPRPSISRTERTPVHASSHRRSFDDRSRLRWVVAYNLTVPTLPSELETIFVEGGSARDERALRPAMGGGVAV